MPRDNRCMYMAHVCFMYVVVTVRCLWECLLCSGLSYSVFKPWNVEVWCMFVLGCDICCVFCLYCDAWSCSCSCMSMSVSSCRWCMFVSGLHHVAVLNAAFC